VLLLENSNLGLVSDRHTHILLLGQESPLDPMGLVPLATNCGGRGDPMVRGRLLLRVIDLVSYMKVASWFLWSIVGENATDLMRFVCSF
jgi:hypothetical protein